MLPPELQHADTMNYDIFSAAKAGIPQKPRVRDHIRRVWHRIKLWMFLYIWCRHCYRHVMWFSHQFNWHHMEPSMMNPQFGEQSARCSWCGLHGTSYKQDPSASLRFLSEEEAKAIKKDPTIWWEN